MSEAEFQALKADIDQYGQREPVWLYEGKVIDGRHRVRACDELGKQVRMEVYDGFDAVAFVVSLNLHRRHLSDAQRQVVAGRIANLDHGGDRKSPTGDLISQQKAADLLNVSKRGVERAAKVVHDGAQELVEAVESGKISVSAAATIAQAPKEQQREIVARGEKEILEAAKQIRLDKAEVRRAEVAKVRAEAPPLPAGKYGVIVIDPPWDMQKIERDVAPNQVGFEYPTMTEEELAAFDVPSISADDCHLFCWTTHKHLPLALRLLDSWGFRYVLTMVWHKPGGFQPFGLPQYNCEFALYARRGVPEFIDTKAFPVCFSAPRREHSRKPDEFYDVIRRVTAGPRIDVFSRESREGFSTFGNESEKFDEVA
jgi:N6-adenosine-specific RNA methylase IME4/ParB-like chromosome segregation protein Spo0J